MGMNGGQRAAIAPVGNAVADVLNVAFWALLFLAAVLSVVLTWGIIQLLGAGVIIPDAAMGSMAAARDWFINDLLADQNWLVAGISIILVIVGFVSVLMVLCHGLVANVFLLPIYARKVPLARLSRDHGVEFGPGPSRLSILGRVIAWQALLLLVMVVASPVFAIPVIGWLAFAVVAAFIAGKMYTSITLSYLPRDVAERVGRDLGNKAILGSFSGITILLIAATLVTGLLSTIPMIGFLFMAVTILIFLSVPWLQFSVAANLVVRTAIAENRSRTD